MPGTTLVEVNQIRFIEKIKVNTGKNMFRKPSIQCNHYHGYSSTNCNKNAVCVKCVGPHITKEYTKSLDVLPTCTNCKGNHTANYFKFPALLSYLAKKNSYKTLQHPNPHHTSSHFLQSQIQKNQLRIFTKTSHTNFFIYTNVLTEQSESTASHLNTGNR